ncbi:Rpn family recombination-promoting nuclease/putative transposase [Aquibacillus sp. 3ASR75-11]|uniref:Rpn family recombination-promoting nuclease/putative transposase n=1 Tax=Terrihalobacillus insolitus TaxID=2950438 RepID=A0A9X3WW89_9BACI|nr:Rpn family recombination-promoting nuclease/putative transposase [Terrihalobacillus insolitus]MDC3414481.1 Rpn family recombination-promoting nuclease/putative transposase [Terrihalobacillus insolitus]MDC3425361.1 Rpn family recombination-promoting nuclease/putative transposase [Terrihalobacillus insolitus]
MSPTTYFTNKSPVHFIQHVKEPPSDFDQQNLHSVHNKRTKLLKQIPLERLMDLKVDYAFKQLFGNEKNKEITVIFLNAILQTTGRSRIKDISFSNTEAGGEYVDDKQSRLDLLVLTDENERINVEIQFTNQYDMIKRSIYYWAGTYRSPLHKKMTYKELRPVIAINIVNFNLFNHTDQFHTSYHLYEDEERFKLTNVMEFHFIEMSKLIQDWKNDKLDPWNNVLARWLLMLGMVDHRNHKVYDDIYRELEEISMKDKSLRDAFENWEELSMTEEEYFAYEARLKRIIDEEAAKREAELNIQEAKQKAEQKAEQKIQESEQIAEQIAEQKVKEAKEHNEKIARRLLTKGMTVKEVAEIIDLDVDRVRKIKLDM